VKERFKDWKPDQPTRVTFDKSEDRFSKSSFPRLAGIAAPKSGLYLAPLRTVERLRSNLLPLELWPPQHFNRGNRLQDDTRSLGRASRSRRRGGCRLAVMGEKTF
jgi:hypothetical protein